MPYAYQYGKLKSLQSFHHVDLQVLERIFGVRIHIRHVLHLHNDAQRIGSSKV